MNRREYNGITWYGDTVWTTYAGTWTGNYDPNDPDLNPAVIASNRIDWP